MPHHLGNAAGNQAHHWHHASSHRFKQRHRQAFKIRHQQDRLALQQDPLHPGKGQATAKADAIGKAGGLHLLLTGWAAVAIADQGGGDGFGALAGQDQRLHHKAGPFLVFPEPAAVDHLEGMGAVVRCGSWD